MIRVGGIAKGLALITCIGLFTGCWDRVEMDDLALVMGSGIDLAEDGQIEATIQIAMPTGISGSMQTGGGAKKKPVLVISAKGKDGIDAISKLQRRLSRRIFLGHRGVIVFGETYARHGIDQVLDTLMRMPDSRSNSYILTSYGATAKEILSIPYDLEQIPAVGINKILAGEFGLPIKIEAFLSDLSADGKSPVTGSIRIIDDGSDKEIFTIDNAAVYKENKLVGFLSGQDLKAFRLLSGQGKKVKITIQMEPKEKESKGTVSVDITHVQTKIRTFIRNGTPQIVVNAKLLSRVWSNDTKLNMTENKNLKLAERKFATESKDMLESMIVLSQRKYKSDIVGFGNKLHIQHPYAWKKIKDQWKDLFPTAQVTVNVDFIIERMGRTQAPPHLHQSDIK